MKANHAIRAPKVRLIGADGSQIGVVSREEALAHAERAQLDLVEISPNAEPPVCKIIDYGKFRYAQTKKEKESKKLQHQIKVKEVKIKPNTDENDLQTKLKHARKFLTEGNKVKITCVFRGRQIAYKEIGRTLIQRMCGELEECGTPEAMPRMLGRMLHVIVAPLKTGQKTAQKKG